MASTELPCYTLIHAPTDGEQPNEMKLREDLEKGDNKVKSIKIPFISFYKVLNKSKLRLNQKH